MGWTLKVVLFGILALAPGAHASFCPQWLAAWGAATAQFVRPSQRAFSRAAYDVARAQARAGSLHLESLSTAEKIFAYVDHLSVGDPFLSQVQAIETMGGTVRFREFRIPLKLARTPGTWSYEWAPRASSAVVRSEWRRFYLVPYPSREALSIITTANAPPRTPQELVDWVARFASQLANHRMLLKAGRTPWLLYCWSAGSFGRGALDELESAERDQYAALAAVLEAFPTAQSPLPKTDGIWRWRAVQTALGLPLRILFPTYNALAPYRANAEHFAAWKANALRSLLDAKYAARLQWKWWVDRYRGALMYSVLLTVPRAGYETYELVSTGEFQERFDQMQTDIKALPEHFSKPVMERRLKSYSETPGGDPDVNAHYNELIQDMEEQIRKHGDPEGHKRRQIAEWIQTRDLLNH